MMLMADMDEGARRAIRRLHAPALPLDAELVETSDGVALVRHPDGVAELVALEGVHAVLGSSITPDAIERRAEALVRLAEDLRRMAAIARPALGQPGNAVGWACGSCGRQFQDEQPVCPACGAEEDPTRTALRIRDRAPDVAVLLELDDGGRAVVRAGSEPHGSDALVVGMLHGQLSVHRDMIRRVTRFLARLRAEGPDTRRSH